MIVSLKRIANISLKMIKTPQIIEFIMLKKTFLFSGQIEQKKLWGQQITTVKRLKIVLGWYKIFHTQLLVVSNLKKISHWSPYRLVRSIIQHPAGPACSETEHVNSIVNQFSAVSYILCTGNTIFKNQMHIEASKVLFSKTGLKPPCSYWQMLNKDKLQTFFVFSVMSD